VVCFDYDGDGDLDMLIAKLTAARSASSKADILDG
jgi:hypothetical protein